MLVISVAMVGTRCDTAAESLTQTTVILLDSPSTSFSHGMVLQAYYVNKTARKTIPQDTQKPSIRKAVMTPASCMKQVNDIAQLTCSIDHNV